MSDGVGEKTVLSRRDVAWREVAGELVIVDPAGNAILGLNGTGGHVWELLDGERTLGQVAAALAERHDVDQAAVLPDVIAFAEALVERGLVDRR